MTDDQMQRAMDYYLSLTEERRKDVSFINVPVPVGVSLSEHLNPCHRVSARTYDTVSVEHLGLWAMRKSKVLQQEAEETKAKLQVTEDQKGHLIRLLARCEQPLRDASVMYQSVGQRQLVRELELEVAMVAYRILL